MADKPVSDNLRNASDLRKKLSTSKESSKQGFFDRPILEALGDAGGAVQDFVTDDEVQAAAKTVGKGAWDILGPDTQARKNLLPGGEEASLKDLGSAALDASVFIPGAGIAAKGVGKAALKNSDKLLAKGLKGSSKDFTDAALKSQGKKKIIGNKLFDSSAARQTAGGKAVVASADDLAKGDARRAALIGTQHARGTRLRELQNKYRANQAGGKGLLIDSVLGRNKSLLNPLTTHNEVMAGKGAALIGRNAYQTFGTEEDQAPAASSAKLQEIFKGGFADDTGFVDAEGGIYSYDVIANEIGEEAAAELRDWLNKKGRK